MARFYFTTKDGRVRSDPEGIELADVAEARREAVRFVGEWLRDQPDEFAGDQMHELTVRNEHQEVMWVITSVMAHGPGDPVNGRPFRHIH